MSRKNKHKDVVKTERLSVKLTIEVDSYSTSKSSEDFIRRLFKDADWCHDSDAYVISVDSIGKLI